MDNLPDAPKMMMRGDRIRLDIRCHEDMEMPIMLVIAPTVIEVYDANNDLKQSVRAREVHMIQHPDGTEEAHEIED